MRLILTLMATCLLAISVGCAPEAPKAAETPAASPAAAPAAASLEADAGGEFQTVSLKVPGMT